MAFMKIKRKFRFMKVETQIAKNKITALVQFHCKFVAILLKKFVAIFFFIHFLHNYETIKDNASTFQNQNFLYSI